MTITLEEALCLPKKISLNQPQNTPHPPSRINLLIEVMNEIQRLKEIRQQVTDGDREADKKLTAEMYITQIVLSAYKISLEAQKEAAKIELIQNNQTTINMDITNQINELIKISREPSANPTS